MSSILEVFRRASGDTFLKEPIFRIHKESPCRITTFPSRNDLIFIYFSMLFLAPPPGHPKINFFTFLTLFGPPFGTSFSHISLTRESPDRKKGPKGRFRTTFHPHWTPPGPPLDIQGPKNHFLVAPASFLIDFGSILIDF